MAYMTQEMKKAIAPQVKALLKKYGLKGSLSVQHHMSLVLTLKSGGIDFDTTKSDVNTFWIESYYEGVARECLTKLKDALNGEGSSEENHDNSDIMTDYFDVGWYINIRVGKWDKPYVLTK